MKLTNYLKSKKSIFQLAFILLTTFFILFYFFVYDISSEEINEPINTSDSIQAEDVQKCEDPPPVLNPDSELMDEKLIALTFDDGPHPTATPKLLDILKEHSVPATFFVLGIELELYPEIVARAYSEGHQIGNHTHSHKNLTSLTTDELQKEIMRTSNLIEDITGKKPTVMRPPYGIYNDQVLSYANAAVINWSVDPEDWKYRDSTVIYNHVTQMAQDGDIILLHDIYETTIEAVSPIILSLKEQGFTFVTVEQLIEARDQLTDGKVYISIPSSD